ncbi:TPA: condensation domain-containing protein [Enterococcus faecium]|nr:methyltransferase domain-containing protein [Enterococcus faecium]
MNLELELIKILSGEKDPIEAFYSDPNKSYMSKFTEELLGYKESINSIINSIKAYARLNNKKNIKILEYGTRNSELTTTIFKELKEFVSDYIYVDSSIYIRNNLSDLENDSKFKYVCINDNLGTSLDEDNFDIVIALNSIHRSNDKKTLIEEMLKVLKVKGLIIGNELKNNNLLPIITADIINEQPFNEVRPADFDNNDCEVLYINSEKRTECSNFITFTIANLKENKPTFEKLRSYLSHEIPSYMIPTYFYHVDEIPLNKNGKADRKKLKKDLLKDVKHSRVISEEITNDISDTEKILLNIWKECLCNENIGVNDNYFIVGGDSLTAASIIGKVKNKMGIEISIKDIFQSASVASLSDFIDKNKMFINRSKIRTLVPDKENIYEPFPLTDVQMAYWIGRQGAYNLGNVSTHCYFEFDSMDINVNKLQKALNDIIEYNPALRTIILNSGEQVILKEVPYYLLNINDLSTLDDNAKENILLQMRESLSHRIIDLSNFPTFDFKVTKITKTLFRIFIGIDNAILDGWSMFEFLKEIKLKYDGDFSSETIEPTFRDYVLYKKQEDRFHYERDKDYWINRLDSFPIMPRLSIMKNDGNNSEQRFKRKEARIKRDDWIEIKRLATEVEVTPTTILLSLFSTILCKYSNSNNFVVNVTQFIKEDIHPEIHKIMGDFTQLCLLEIKLDKSKTILENAKEIQEQLLSDMMHSSYSSIEFLRDLREKKQTDMIAPIIFTSGLGMKGNRNVDFLGELNYSISQTPQVWLDHQVIELDEDLILTWDYVEEIFNSETIDYCFYDYIEVIKEFLLKYKNKTSYFLELNKFISQNKEFESGLSVEIKAAKTKLEDENIDSTLLKGMGFSKDIQSSKLKKEIKEMYKEILGVKKINDEDNFFSLGGNSLNMIQLSNKLFENYEYQLDFAEFLENSDVSYIFVKLIDFLIKEQGD